MQVQTAHAPASIIHDGRSVYFCSDHCQHRFEADPEKYAKAPREGSHGPSVMPDADTVDPSGIADAIDPVCGMTVDPEQATHRRHDGTDFYFCCAGCAEAFMADPSTYLPTRSTT
jgi:YHS domain-containing protein